MTQGRVVLRALLPLAASLAALAVLPTLATPLKPRLAAPAHASLSKAKSATFMSADDQAVHVRLADGSALDAGLRPSSLFLKNGVTAQPSDFKAGDPVHVRTRTRASDGAVWVTLLCDPATDAAFATYRKKPLTGAIQSLDDKTLTLKPTDSAIPIMLHVTPKTLFRKNGADAASDPFTPGQTVTVITRGLPSGLLMAAVVSDRSADAVQEKTLLKPTSVSGVAVAVQPSENTLTLVNKKTKTRQTLAVTDETRVKVRKQAATLADITAGMRVTARIGHAKDAAGHPLATSLSAFDGSRPDSPRKRS